MKELSGLDGKGFDNRPLALRKEVFTQKLTVESVFDLDAFTKEDGSFDSELVAVERYAFSSFLIEAMWENLKQRENTYSTYESPVIPINKDFWKLFADYYVEVVQKKRYFR